MADLERWFSGSLTSSERVVTAVGPPLAIVLYFVLAALLYLVRARFRGPFRDEEMDGRGDGGVSARGLRHFFAWTMRPFWTVLARLRFPPDVITTLSIAVAFGAGVAVAAGRFSLGGWLFMAAGMLDYLDGRVARSIGQTSEAGAALDSVLDRYVESALLVGLAWYYRGSWVLVPCLLALTGSLLVPYVRARGEALGARMKDVGFMQRPERIVVLSIGTALSPIIEVWLAPGVQNPPHRLAIFAVLLIAVTAHVTAIQRLLALLRLLAGPTAVSANGRPVRSLLVNLTATLVDLAVAGSFYYLTTVSPSVATGAGCVVGAIVSFTLSRSWAFEPGGSALVHQLSRYAFASATTAVLNAGGVALVLMLNLPFIVGWVVVRGVVFATWSYPVQRDFVFGPTLPGRPSSRGPRTSP
jgi:phosphatidylglycerophosphate synthase/putative flippase GtrA